MVRHIAAILVLLVLAPGLAEAKRIALVIGNAAYRDAPLANPVNDARDIASRLEALDFEVVRRTDATRAEMGLAVADFLRRLGDGDEALVFYAGHGVQVRGVNWLMPIDASPRDENEVEFQAISLDSLLRGLSEKRPKVSLLMLDACRNNPFERRWRGGAGGLARVEAASGTLISYAAKPGTTAADGRGRNSPYTTAWLKELERPGLAVEDILKRVHVAVRNETNGLQETWQEGQIVGQLVLNVNVTVAAPSPPGFDARQIELKFWESAEREDSVAGYQAYLAEYPTGAFAALARAKLARLEAAAAAPASVAALVAPPAATPADAETGLALDVPARRDVQRWLAALGFDAGGADGMFGAGTRRAIAAWQESLAQPATGYLEPPQYELLGERGRAALTAPRPAPVATPAVVPVRPPAAPPPAVTPAVGTYGSRPVAGTRFRDCASCPEMVWLPAGEFTMGSPASEEGRNDDEGPQRRVRIGYPLAVGVHEVTRGEFSRFVSSTGRSMGDSCWAYEGGKWEERSGRNWRSPGFSQGDDHPVVCVSWEDATAYVAWLGRETGKSYRLLSESEWEYAARGGTSTARWWGTTAAAACRSANVSDETRADAHNLKRAADNIFLCRDGHVHTAPVGSFGANRFGLHDALGNVWEWVADCWNGSYSGAPSDGTAWTSGECSRRVVRGGTWVDGPRFVRAAFRGRLDVGDRDDSLGFRVARTD